MVDYELRVWNGTQAGDEETHNIHDAAHLPRVGERVVLSLLEKDGDFGGEDETYEVKRVYYGFNLDSKREMLHYKGIEYWVIAHRVD